VSIYDNTGGEKRMYKVVICGAVAAAITAAPAFCNCL